MYVCTLYLAHVLMNQLILILMKDKIAPPDGTCDLDELVVKGCQFFPPLSQEFSKKPSVCYSTRHLRSANGTGNLVRNFRVVQKLIRSSASQMIVWLTKSSFTVARKKVYQGHFQCITLLDTSICDQCTYIERERTCILMFGDDA